MTDPKQSDNGWNLQDLPVLTEVVAESAGGGTPTASARWEGTVEW